MGVMTGIGGNFATLLRTMAQKTGEATVEPRLFTSKKVGSAGHKRRQARIYWMPKYDE
jgi:hypothetical protein